MSSNNGSARPSPRNRLSSLPENQSPPGLEARRQAAVHALHEQFDRLNAVWAEKEKELIAMNVPMDVWHEYKSLGPRAEDGNGETYLIGVTRWGGKRRLVWSWYDWHREFDPETKPIVEAALEDRLEAAPHFEALREKVIEAAEKAIQKVEEAIAALSK